MKGKISIQVHPMKILIVKRINTPFLSVIGTIYGGEFFLMFTIEKFSAIKSFNDFFNVIFFSAFIFCFFGACNPKEL